MNKTVSVNYTGGFSRNTANYNVRKLKTEGDKYI